MFPEVLGPFWAHAHRAQDRGACRQGRELALSLNRHLLVRQLTQSMPRRTFAYNREPIMSTHGPDKNIALAPDLLAEVEKLASSEHRTTDEIMNEAARK